jgi:putative colanic acid biosynthesis UDP-glucose lipid carrier transferase
VPTQQRSIPALKTVFPSFEGFGAIAGKVPRSQSAKRALDVVAALLLLVLTLPLLALLAIAIALDSPGPVLFAQRRIGLNGKPFAIYKFRTMHVLEDGAEIQQAVRGDARITRVGNLIRGLSLDELPQLFNVLAGEMSLAGPRPHAVAHEKFYEARIGNYHLRRLVKPGITGWAQIHGCRGATPEMSDMQKRVDLDQFYVERGTLALDLEIMARTPAAVLSGRNAH